MLDKIIEACRFLLNNYPGARASKDYLNSRLNEINSKIFQFGYFPEAKNISILIDLVGEEILRKEKLLFTQEIEDSLFPRKIQSSYFEDHPLIISFRNPYGQVAGLVGRTILSDKEQKEKKISKYKNTPNSSTFKKGNMVFGLYENKNHILDQGCVYLVEGQLDVIKASEIGFRNVVALGTGNMTPYQLSVISRYSNNIFLLLDNDEAGQRGRDQIINKFGHMANIRNFYLPDEYKDIDELIARTNISDFTEIPFLVKD